MADENLAAIVNHSGGSYPVVAGWGILDDLGSRLVDLGLKGPAYIITDTAAKSDTDSYTICRSNSHELFF